MRKFLLLLPVCALLMSACTGNTYYTESRPIEDGSWPHGKAVEFSVDVQDTTQIFDMLLYVQNTTDYPHQNLWLTVEERQPTGNTTCDTIQFYLADARGQWLGNGIGNLKEMPVLYRQHCRYAVPGVYTYAICQLMRDSALVGLRNIELRLDKVN